MEARPVLMSAIAGCKMSKLGVNEIGSQNTFLQCFFFNFYHISGIRWTLKMAYVFKY